MNHSVKRLAYFRWLDPQAALRVLEGSRDLSLVQLDLERDDRANWAEFNQAQGYQLSARTESRVPWFADANMFERSPGLLAVCSSGAGYDTMDLEAATAAGVIACNQAGANKEAVAEHALGFMLALSKKIALADHLLRKVASLDRFAVMGNDIRGKTLGIVGIGHVGAHLAKMCRGAFDMDVLACDPYLSAEQIGARGATKVELNELLRRADFVSVSCALTNGTNGMIGKSQFALMKPGAFFISTARGGIHDESDLADALTAGRIAGAGLDVFVQEPPPQEHPLLAFDNVLASPHTAGITVEALRNASTAAAEQWLTIFAGKVPPCLLNPQAWPRYSERFAKQFGFRPEGTEPLS